MIRALSVAVAIAAGTNDSGPLIGLAEGGSDVNSLLGSDVNGLWRRWSGPVVPGR